MGCRVYTVFVLVGCQMRVNVQMYAFNFNGYGGFL
mgnify:CR=1 FL=1